MVRGFFQHNYTLLFGVYVPQKVGNASSPPTGLREVIWDCPQRAFQFCLNIETGARRGGKASSLAGLTLVLQYCATLLNDNIN